MQGVRRVLDIRIGEPKKIRLVHGRDLHAFVQRPELSCPARGEGSRGMNFHALRSAGFIGSFLREVADKYRLRAVARSCHAPERGKSRSPAEWHRQESVMEARAILQQAGD